MKLPYGQETRSTWLHRNKGLSHQHCNVGVQHRVCSCTSCLGSYPFLLLSDRTATSSMSDSYHRRMWVNLLERFTSVLKLGPHFCHMLLWWARHQVQQKFHLSAEHQHVWCQLSAVLLGGAVGHYHIRKMFIPAVMILITKQTSHHFIILLNHWSMKS